MEQLSEDDRRALRGSKFAPLPAPPPKSRPRLAHPGGPMTSNKAAALAKFLERKQQQRDWVSSIDPKLVELAVKNAKETVKASDGETSSSGAVVRHVPSFDDSEYQVSGEEGYKVEQKKRKKKKKKVTKNAKAKKSKL